jgi:fibronectin-binding autotransporter adhesin
VVNNGALDLYRTDTLIIGGAISGNGSLTQYTGTVILTGNNTYQGATTINSGTLQLGNGGTSGTLSNVTTIYGYSGTVLAFNRSNSFTLGSSIGGSVAVNQNGAGTTTLSATNTYNGATTINAGTLLVSGSISGSTTTVNSTGTLAGTGTVGPVNVASGGTVLPGSSTGSGLLNSGNVSFASGSHFVLELGGTTGTNTSGTTYSELKVTGTISLAGDVQVSLFGAYTPHVNDVFYIIINGGSNTVSGAFSNAAGGVFFSDGMQFSVNYAATTGSTTNDVSIKILSLVPEPGSWPLLLSGCVFLAGFQRRRPARPAP